MPAAPAPDRELTFADLPSSVAEILAAIADAGHEVSLVGGVVRDHLAGVSRIDWDAATSAHPEQVASLFPGATWENRYGTVTIAGPPAVEVTSYRTEGGYRDNRRPDEVRFGASLTDDLARRDFTVNAMAWVPIDLERGRGRLVDPHGGERDLAARTLRTVGDPRERFGEDALRLIRAARIASRYGLSLDAATEAAIVDLAPSAATISGERIRDELLRILRLDPTPSVAIGLLERWGVLRVVLPELAALRGVPQSKALPGDALDHTYRAVDVADAAGDPDLRLLALLHDLGKATTLRDGHFIGHDRVGAELADEVLRRLRMPRARAARVVRAIEQHMYDYDRGWTDAAVRRFIRRLHGTDRDLLFALRRADNAASGVGDAGETNQAELESRIAAEIERQPGLLVDRLLAIDGNDLQRELGMAPGPELGATLERLAELVLEDPSRNRRDILLELAQRR